MINLARSRVSGKLGEVAGLHKVVAPRVGESVGLVSGGVWDIQEGLRQGVVRWESEDPEGFGEKLLEKKVPLAWAIMGVFISAERREVVSKCLMGATHSIELQDDFEQGDAFVGFRATETGGCDECVHVCMSPVLTCRPWSASRPECAPSLNPPESVFLGRHPTGLRT
ncbi:hypothetical protein GW17_00036022 [Ensete ventricosum]|nr:hypothetical protein GW17_00036022 [Ensete ventricosum]